MVLSKRSIDNLFANRLPHASHLIDMELRRHREIAAGFPDVKDAAQYVFDTMNSIIEAGKHPNDYRNEVVVRYEQFCEECKKDNYPVFSLDHYEREFKIFTGVANDIMDELLNIIAE